MLCIFNRFRDLDFSALMEIYLEGNRENASVFYPDESPDCGLRLAEQDFYQYLRECFFTVPGAQYAVWIENGTYVSALRLEPYQDGLLLEALETKPGYRRKGYAKKMILEVLARLSEGKRVPVYSHVSKRNTASLKTHESCGFRKILDYAVYANGSVKSDASTYRFDFERI